MTQTKQLYSIRLSALLNGISLVGADLEFLCSLVEDPDEEYRIPDAVEYSGAVVALMNQLAYMSEEIAHNDLTEDGEFVQLSLKEVKVMNKLHEEAEEAIGRLRQCGISLEQN